jgi:hypothetical protein
MNIDREFLVRHAVMLSYVCLLAYLVSPLISFWGDFILYAVAMLGFIYLRFVIHTRCESEKKKKRYVQIGIGYLVFLAFQMLLLPLVALVPIEQGGGGILYSVLLRPGVVYIVPASIYMLILDRSKNRPDEPASLTDK